MPHLPWISVEDALPRDGQAVLVRRNLDNWGMSHTLEDGSTHRIWRWKTAMFVMGKTKEQLDANTLLPIRGQDEYGNNRRPYHWETFGSGNLFGQEVSHWVAISDPTADDD